jgi:transposase
MVKSQMDEGDKGRGLGAVPRLNTPNRSQMELRAVDLEGLLPADHPARAVWSFVESLELSELYTSIRAVEGAAGRPATDPRIFMALWIYATVEGVGSARAIERLTEAHDAYRWICGGVSVNYHSLSDFRVQHVAVLDKVLTQSVAVLMAQGLVTLKRVSQDGMRVRASAGAASFRRGERLGQYLREAEAQVRQLREELEADPDATNRRQIGARERAAKEREERVRRALELLPKAQARKGKRGEARVSTTDPEANVMKMADGGFRPAYNGQLAVDTGSQIVTGVLVSTRGTDQGHITPMLEQHVDRYGQVPEETLVDGGFVSLRDFETAAEKGTQMYAPPIQPKDQTRSPYEPLLTDSAAIADWRVRMGTEQGKEIYKQRAATSECVNALARNRGLHRLLVRGEKKVLAILLWYAIAHNVMRGLTLCAAAALDAG